MEAGSQKLTNFSPFQHPDLLRPYTVGTFDSPEVTPLHFFFQASAMECLNTVQANADLEKFAAKYAAFAEQIVEHERSVLSQSDDPEAFVVLNHGDMWPNNIFFKRDAAGLVSDALFVSTGEFLGLKKKISQKFLKTGFFTF